MIDCVDYIASASENQEYMITRPRLYHGSAFAGFLRKTMKELGGQLITGSQLEYYPDHEQMTYLENQLGNYNGFVMQESDFYLETLEKNFHFKEKECHCLYNLGFFVECNNSNKTM